jgi:hypothetical protein
MNTKGIKFIHDRATPMAIDTMDAAGAAIARAIAQRDERIKAGEPRTTDEAVQFGRHCAWLIGFDHLIDDRIAIREFTDKIVVAE